MRNNSSTSWGFFGPTTVATSTTIMTAAGVLAAVVAYDRLRRNKNRRFHDNNDDRYYLKRCHEFRLRLSKPRHSGFRVVALLLLENGETIFGCNDEPAVSISGALCAERAALLSYRIQYPTITTKSPMIASIYIVSDHPHQAITPGCLCREYMYGHPAIDPQSLRIILQSADPNSIPVQVSLCDLYPFPSILARHCFENVMQAMEISKMHAQNHHILDWQTCPVGMDPHRWSQIQRLHHSGLEYLQQTQQQRSGKETVYPMAYVASILIAYHDDPIKNDNEQNSIISSTQVSTLEYGCTQDAVCRVLAKLSQQQEQRPIPSSSFMLLLQMDSNGVPHAPFAAARSLLVEQYTGDPSCPPIHVVVYDGENPIQVIPASQLAPQSPQIA